MNRTHQAPWLRSSFKQASGRVGRDGARVVAPLILRAGLRTSGKGRCPCRRSAHPSSRPQDEREDTVSEVQAARLWAFSRALTANSQTAQMETPRGCLGRQTARRRRSPPQAGMVMLAVLSLRLCDRRSFLAMGDWQLEMGERWQWRSSHFPFPLFPFPLVSGPILACEETWGGPCHPGAPPPPL
jgi:hypothetical protein